MGLIRFLLAAAVVLGHAPGWGSIPSFSPPAAGFLMPYHAVQAFFVLSGFYMSLIYPRYEGVLWKFYVNRYSRLIVSFWIVSAVTVLLWVLYPTNPIAAPYLKNFAESRGVWAVVIAIPNLFMIGSDSFVYFPRSLPQYWIIPQGWTLGTELWFYLLVPLLVPARARALVALIAAGLILRLGLVAAGAEFHPWQQRVFFSELTFFLVGIFAHRLYVRFADAKRFTVRGGWVALMLAALFVSSGTHILPVRYGESLWNSALIALVLYLLLPWCHYLSKDWSIDRFIGEFSYPVYLWHIAIGYFFVPAQRLWDGYFLLLLCVLASLPLVIFVERPLERWRQRSLSEARKTLVSDRFDRRVISSLGP